MEIPDELRAADVSRVVADWGTPITWRVVTQTFSPGTQQITESVSDTTVNAILGRRPLRMARGTGGEWADRELAVWVRAADLPGSEATLDARLVHDGVEYDVIAAERSPDGLLWQVTARRR